MQSQPRLSQRRRPSAVRRRPSAVRRRRRGRRRHRPRRRGRRRRLCPGRRPRRRGRRRRRWGRRCPGRRPRRRGSRRRRSWRRFASRHLMAEGRRLRLRRGCDGITSPVAVEVQRDDEDAIGGRVRRDRRRASWGRRQLCGRTRAAAAELVHRRRHRSLERNGAMRQTTTRWPECPWTVGKRARPNA